MLQSRVLVVDSDDVQQEVIACSLEDSGFDVRRAGDALAGLDCLATGDGWIPDVVFFHQRIPGDDAWQFVSDARRVASSDVPVVLLSADWNGPSAHEATCFAALMRLPIDGDTVVRVAERVSNEMAGRAA